MMSSSWASYDNNRVAVDGMRAWALDVYNVKQQQQQHRMRDFKHNYMQSQSDDCNAVPFCAINFIVCVCLLVHTTRPYIDTVLVCVNTHAHTRPCNRRMRSSGVCVRVCVNGQ